LSKPKKDLLPNPWHEAQAGVQAELLAQEGETYMFARSRDRIAKERAMRSRQLKKLSGHACGSSRP
jgi:hypothetical protein